MAAEFKMATKLISLLPNLKCYFLLNLCKQNKFFKMY
jgi:hypothetical protein